ncbi:MAG: TRAP transporter small permease [Gammaproteobacteria bacterium]|nr:TRAP transporter small permease [Gammaproteobacteria bacterium]
MLFVGTGVILTYEVCARYFLNSPTIWAAEISQLGLIWGVMLGLPWCLASRHHIRITAIIGKLTNGPRVIAEIIAMMAIAIFSVIVCWFGWEIFIDSWDRGRTTGTMLDIPAWIAELSIPFGFAILFIQSIVETIRALSGDIPADEEIQE